MVWGRVAFAHDWQLPLERAVLATAINLVAPHGDDVLLDVGTGTGGVLSRARASPRSPAEGDCVDTTTGMLGKAGALPDEWSLAAGDAPA